MVVLIRRTWMGQTLQLLLLMSTDQVSHLFVHLFLTSEWYIFPLKLQVA